MAPDPNDLLDAVEDDDSTAILSLAKLRAASTEVALQRYLLVRIGGDEIGQVINLEDTELSIGRQPTSGLILMDPGISRQHARIVWQDQAHVIEDLGSANGTYVERERITRRTLHDGDVIQLGPNILFRYSVTDSNQEAMLQHLYRTSVTDALTEARNREYFDTRLMTEFAYARRHDVELSLLMIDIDHFKQINDTYGHQIGDVVLRELAQTIQRGLRSEDVFCRYGGEEFSVILRTTDETQAQSVAERVREAVECLTIDTGEATIRVTISVGCATLSQSAEPSTEDLVKEADRCLYLAKNSGRNRVVSKSRS